MRKLLTVFLAISFLVVGIQAQARQKKNVPKVIAAATLAATKPASTGTGLLLFFKHAGQTALGGVELGVDVIHDGFYAADKAFDFLSLQGKLPILDQIYALVSVTSDDTGKLDDALDKL